jgi:hypothetical protein
MNLTKEKHATFTPGPWVNRGAKISTWKPFARSYNVIATVEQEKDARLIAAAPDLLAQCKLFEKCLTYLINSGDSGADLDRDKLREVLAKVEGSEG